jgi:hypothetical protein
VKFAALTLTGALLAGCDGFSGQTLPDGVSAADVALFKTAVTEAGCAIETTTDAVPIAAQTGFDRDKLAIITQYLVLAGESEPTANGFRLTSGTCANA